MLDANIKKQLSNYFQGIDRPVELLRPLMIHRSLKELLDLVNELGRVIRKITVKGET